MRTLLQHSIHVFIVFAVFMSSTVVLGQDYAKVDATVSFYPDHFTSDQALAAKIKNDFTNPKEQVRAGYSWLIHNVAYEPKEYYTYKFQYRILEERNEKMAKTREAIIERTLQQGVAVCEGYALTLERLCELLGIQAYVVRGDTKTQPSDIGRPFDKNHMWMVAVIDEKPMLLDPTWGAGRYNGKFIKSPSYDYYDTPPAHFIKNHYPEVFDDAYVAISLSREAFSKQPLVIDKRLTLQQVSPIGGIIKAKTLSKGIIFSLEGIKGKDVSYTLDGGEKTNVDFSIENNAVQCMIAIKTKAQSLVIYVDDAPTIAYRIKK